MMKIYRGLILKDAGCLKKKVIVDDIYDISKLGIRSYELPLYLEEVDHSPTGFEWGYIGSGPAQLAYAILRDYGLSPEKADKYHIKFMYDVISRFPSDKTFVINSNHISVWLVAMAYDPNIWTEIIKMMK